jgi:hypothetical protein
VALLLDHLHHEAWNVMLAKLQYGQLTWDKFMRDISGRLNEAILSGVYCRFFLHSHGMGLDNSSVSACNQTALTPRCSCVSHCIGVLRILPEHAET